MSNMSEDEVLKSAMKYPDIALSDLLFGKDCIEYLEWTGKNIAEISKFVGFDVKTASDKLFFTDSAPRYEIELTEILLKYKNGDLGVYVPNINRRFMLGCLCDLSSSFPLEYKLLGYK
jgi:hypothetical protein